MPTTISSTAIPAFLNPSAKAGLLPSSRVQEVARNETSLNVPQTGSENPVPASSSTPPPGSAPAPVIAPPEPQRAAQPVNDFADFPLPAQQALQAFERTAANGNVIGSDAVEGIDIFV